MKKFSLKHLIIVLTFSVLILAADRIFKYAALNNLNNDIKLIDGFLKLSLQKNIGIAFSIGLPMTFQLFIFPVLAGVGIYFVVKYLDIKNIFLLIITGSIAGAALSNFFDRLILGYVIDYISVSYFPVFNFADMVIVCGIFIIITFYGKIKRVQI